MDELPAGSFSPHVFEANGFSKEKVEIYRGRLEEFEQSHRELKAEILVSEVFGSIALYDSSLKDLLLARDYCFASQGLMFPDRFRFKFCLFMDSSQLASSRKLFWLKSAYDVDLSFVAENYVAADPFLSFIEPEAVSLFFANEPLSYLAFFWRFFAFLEVLCLFSLFWVFGV